MLLFKIIQSPFNDCEISRPNFRTHPLFPQICPTGLVLASIDHVQQLLLLGRRRQVLVPALRHQDAVLGAAAAHGVVALDHVPLNELSVHGVVAEEALEVGAVEVQAGLDGEHHAGAQDGALLLGRRGGAEPVHGDELRRRHHGALAVADAADRLGRGGHHEGHVADDVVHLETDVVAEAVREKGRSGAGGDELLARAAQDAELEEAVNGDARGEVVDFVKEGARLHGGDALGLHARDNLANGGRTRRKRTGHGQGAGDVTGVAAVLAARVEDDGRAALERRIVRAVVQRGAVGAGAGDDGVSLAVGIARGADGLEDGLHLALVGHAQERLGDAAVGGARDVVGAADERDFVPVLDLARAVHGRLQRRGVDGRPIAGARAEGLVLDELRRALVGVQRVHSGGGGQAGNVVSEVAGVVCLVDIVEARGLGGGGGRPEPMALLGIGIGNPEGEAVEANVVGDCAAGVIDTGEVVEAGRVRDGQVSDIACRTYYRSWRNLGPWSESGKRRSGSPTR